MPSLLKSNWLRPTNGCVCLEATSKDFLEFRPNKNSWIDTDKGPLYRKIPVLKKDAKMGTVRILEIQKQNEKEHPVVFADYWRTIEIYETDLKAGEKNLFIFSEPGPLEPYSPLETSTGLFLQFANLRKNPDSILEFASKFGLLRNIEKAESIYDWYKSIKSLKKATLLWEKAKKERNFSLLAKVINKRLLSLKPLVVPSSDKEKLIFGLYTPDLEGQIWLQFAQTVSLGQSLRQCAYCPTWFTYGTGTGRRKSAHFCSDACRKASHRKGGKQ